MAPTKSLLPLPATDDPTHFVHIISNLLSESECAHIISSHTNLLPSNLTYGTIRKREQFDDHELANRLWERLREFYEGDRVQDEDGSWWIARGLNWHFRISKYEKRGKFTAHYDYARHISPNEKTFMSVNIYLNTVPPHQLGSTRILKHEDHHDDYWDGFEELEAIAKIQPVLGSASVFRDTLWHDGEELLGGVKYLLRTDVVYEREVMVEFERGCEELGMGRAGMAGKAREKAEELELDENRVEAGWWYAKAASLDPERY